VENIVFIILIATMVAVFLNLLLNRFQIPTIIGYIITGIFISYLFSLHSNDKLAGVAEFGIVFLMFTIGLEFSLEHLKKMKKDVFFFGVAQVLLSGGIFSLIAENFFDIEKKSAIIIGFAFALSSTAIVLKILNDNGDIHSGYGRKVLGILLFQDIAVIPLLLMINIFSNEGTQLSALLFETFISAVIVIGLLFVIGKYLLNPFFKAVVSSSNDEIFIASVILITIGSSYLAHAFGFTYSLGAFVAGMMIAETKYKHQVEADLIPFRDILLGLFFITIGMQIDLQIIREYWVDIVLILVNVMALKALIIFVLLFSSTNKRVALKSAISISQVGEFSLAIFALASANNLIDGTVNQILIVMVAMSMILTPFMLRNVKKIADFLTGIDDLDVAIHSAHLENHIIVCGYGKLGQEIVKELKRYNVKYVVIEKDINLVKKAKDKNEPVFFGNAAMKSILKAFDVESSRAVIVAVNNEKKLRLICELLDSFKKPVNSVVRVVDTYEEEMLKDLHVNHVVNQGRVIASSLVKEAIIED